LEDQFLTIVAPAEGYYMERGSKFLAYANPVQSEEEAQSFLQSVKKEHPKARHYCSALRLYPDASLERSNDDGEPSGSAGKPILGQLIKNNLTNTCIVVVRYFGGTKLGIPGLIEAYKTSAANAIEASKIVERRLYGKVLIHLSYDSFPHFLNYCKQNNIPVLDESFSDQASIMIGLRKSYMQTDLMTALHQFSRMDFRQLEEYAFYLGMRIEFQQGEYIL
jgi:uncharacterized YigZ family protein